MHTHSLVPRRRGGAWYTLLAHARNYNKGHVVELGMCIYKMINVHIRTLVATDVTTVAIKHMHSVYQALLVPGNETHTPTLPRKSLDPIKTLSPPKIQYGVRR